ncbi:RcpC/CpaB family pilus assembly protein [Streptomyces sp. TRM 70351]|uniref:RcpC/CpaB family pilus assembly protein n=1 Tax=Streptomyces sp. TRM 70351 TaxID=3116552 RepID=UPI002E7BBA59|nr:RcpC/CpaB family pilus assembly protein [Streptomyces sp. TRM 70351]MEE1929499.1 RcpC/CpaB family pilus assembly protein [Streptomyces sp. TRM 70351]
MSTPAPCVPPARAVPHFAPVRPRGAVRSRLRVVLRRTGRTVACVLAASALGVAALGPPGGADRPPDGPGAAGDAVAGRTAADAAAAGPPTVPAGATGAEGPAGAPPELVRAPVRIADAAVVRLLEPGDLVDVLAAPPDIGPGGDGGSAADARLVARRAEVAQIPGTAPGGARPRGGPEQEHAPEPIADGALVVLSVPRATAARLAGAAARTPLAVTLW